MNCNKCGTPILPGENVCRFCGSVDDFSVRAKEEPKPEIIDFNINDEVEVVDFMIGEDDVSINPEPKEKPIDPNEIIDFSFDAPTQNPVAEQPIEQNQVVQDSFEQPVVQDSVVEQPVTPVVNAVIEEPATARIPVEEVQNYLNSEEKIDEPAITEPTIDQSVVDSITEMPSLDQPVAPTMEENKEVASLSNDAPKKEKDKSKIGIIVLTILLILSIVLNCFLLMGRAESPDVNDGKVSDVSLTSVYSNYEIQLPNNWNVNSTSSEYLLIYDGSENWAASINFQSDLDYSLIGENISNITDEFGENNYLFTSDYTKTVNNEEFFIFKGKYYAYTVYLIINQVDENTVAITDLKFVGEVEDDVLNSLLDSLTTVSTKNMSNFLKDNFEFNDISNILSNVIS